MSEDPVKSLIEELGAHLSQKEHSDVVLNNGKGKQFLIAPSEFSEIKPIDSPRKIAFVDGGDGPLEESPNYLITINRVYYSLFQGKQRIKPKANPRVQFYSYVTSNIHTVDGKKNVSYNTRLFPHSPEDKRYLPVESDLTSDTESTTVLQGARLNSLGRRFAEWQLAIHVIETELEQGDMIVMDGSLQTNFKNEIKYANRLYDLAASKGVIICGLAKTSRLITESGDPLLARIAEIAEDVPFEKWYVKVAEEVSADDKGFMLAVKFHAKSRFVFRFEILREQFEAMNPDELNSVLGSLVENSQDVAMIGYPYGAIDADRFAQVRLDELNMYKGFILSEMLKRPEWKRLQKYSASLGAHDTLNGVTS
ncbi:nura domain-containing protein [Marine Group I thaumarchaeote SCGC RSA3]|uniref:NurA domain-containing protein n=2 Tax=Marine Group I TaxID=905826 RepID=A0A081RP03_9ARCH|nr:NurA domain-containing protein [Marine Group I thaumarchaeote SCGC AAA799-N04]KFM17408.1 nura domain-containing protein [Marine Group I thaumarchaeote SCGC RSA3]